MLSLDYITENDDEMGCSHLELITDKTSSVESIAEDKIELERLFARLNELMPEAVKIGELRQITFLISIVKYKEQNTISSGTEGGFFKVRQRGIRYFRLHHN